jgi:SAM-dependent methyltransferase
LSISSIFPCCESEDHVRAAREDPSTAAEPAGTDHGSAGTHQQRVTAHFDAAGHYWQAVYDDPRLQGVIYRERQRSVLQRVDELSPPRGTSVLEIGCGAGLLTVELAGRGYDVRAVDASDVMVELAAARLRAAGLIGNVSAQVADVHALPHPDGAFSLVVAVGLLPWLEWPARALQEIARVLEPHGVLVLTADNRARLNALVDPRANPLLAPIKRLRRRLRPRPAGATQRLHFPSHVNSLVKGAGFRLERTGTVGFGPFSFWGHEPLSDVAAIRLHERLQALADRGVPLLRSTGWQYVLSARKQRRG